MPSRSRIVLTSPSAWKRKPQRIDSTSAGTMVGKKITARANFRPGMSRSSMVRTKLIAKVANPPTSSSTSMFPNDCRKTGSWKMCV